MSEPDGSEAESTLISAAATTGRAGRGLNEGDVVGGNYKIVSYVGRGGMGVVYKALHLAIGRDVALKALAPERVGQENWERFQSEGKAIGRLDHQNIVKVYDMGTEGADCLYYVMDLLQGVSLADYIRQKNFLNGPRHCRFLNSSAPDSDTPTHVVWCTVISSRPISFFAQDQESQCRW